MLNRKPTPIPERSVLRKKIDFLIEELKNTSGVSVKTEDIQDAYYKKFHPNGNHYYYGKKQQRQELLRVLQKAAEADLIDGDWVGTGYLWSLKPRDRMLVKS